MTLFDASALLIWLQDEQGAAVVDRELRNGGVVGAANWSEVAQKVAARGTWPLARALLLSHDLRVEPVIEEDAERAAALWRPGAGLSLADRLCLALRERLATTVWTADRAWGTTRHVKQVR